MTQVAAICKALLDGKTLSIMTGFQMFGCTNLPRELSRGVEQKFGVEISKDRIDFTSRYGQSGYYFRYRLNKTPYNAKGIELMKTYIEQESNGGKDFVKTKQQPTAASIASSIINNTQQSLF